MVAFCIQILGVVSFLALIGRGDTTTGEDGTMGADLGNGLLEWRIFPTSVLKVAEESQRSSKMTSKIATKVTSKLTKVLHRQAREPQGGPVSRDELFHRLLKDQRNEIHVEDFLWTGSGDGELPETDYDDPGSALDDRLDVKIMPTTVTMTATHVSTMTKYVTKPADNFGGTDEYGRPVVPGPNNLGPIVPTPALPPGMSSSISTTNPYTANEPFKTLPQEKFIVRTILHSNMTIIHNKVENFKAQLEEKLTRAYRRAYNEDKFPSRWTRSVNNRVVAFPHGRYIRAAVESETETEEEETTTTTIPTTTMAENTEMPLQDPPPSNIRHHKRPPRVHIHNIRSGLPHPEIEVLYTVYQDEEPIPANLAVEALQEVEDSDVEQFLGLPLVVKAEPYLARPQHAGPHVMPDEGKSQYLMAALIVSAFVIILVVLALVFLLHKAKRAGLSFKDHSRLMGSPDHTTMERSSQAPTSPDGSMDRAAFTLDRPHSTKPGGGLVRVTSSQDMDDDADNNKAEDTSPNGKGSRAQTRSSLHVEGALSRASSHMAGAESPSLADLSSNNGDDSPHRAKKGGGAKRKSRNARNLLTPTGYSSGAEIISQSAFPIPTPDRLGPLTDLLEEDMSELPSRETSGKKRPDWSFLPRPKSPGSTTTSSESIEDGLSVAPWQEEVAKTREMAKQYRKVLDETFGTRVEEIEDIEVVVNQPDDQNSSSNGSGGEPSSSLKKRAISAKSHIFRKGKIETKLAKIGRGNKTRPWSAHESRLQADPIFHMRKRHWEGLIQGKKKVHRGQLLPGSTSEEDESKKKPPTCWSECSSPRKQVRLENSPPTESPGGAQEVATPLIKAIKEELQKFQRPKSPNLAGISIINDPDLLQQETKD